MIKKNSNEDKNTFQDEKEMESYIANNSFLLENYQSKNLALWHRQVYLEGVGFPDLIFIDENMVPVFVEVKLWQNAESRREIVGQLFDYVSFFSSIANQGMDKLWDIKLENAINLIMNKKEENIEKQLSILNRNLALGNVRLVLALNSIKDDNNEEKVHKEHLLRLLEFYNSNNNLPIELYEIINENESDIIKPYYPPVKYYSMNDAIGDCSTDTWNIFKKVFDNLTTKYPEYTINAIQCKYKEHDEKGTEGQIRITIDNSPIIYFNLNKRHLFNIRLPFNNTEMKNLFNEYSCEVKILGEPKRVKNHFNELMKKKIKIDPSGSQVIYQGEKNKINHTECIDKLILLINKFIETNKEKL